jgi:hypothetical protein
MLTTRRNRCHLKIVRKLPRARNLQLRALESERRWQQGTKRSSSKLCTRRKRQSNRVATGRLRLSARSSQPSFRTRPLLLSVTTPCRAAPSNLVKRNTTPTMWRKNKKIRRTTQPGQTARERPQPRSSNRFSSTTKKKKSARVRVRRRLRVSLPKPYPKT